MGYICDCRREVGVEDCRDADCAVDDTPAETGCAAVAFRGDGGIELRSGAILACC